MKIFEKVKASNGRQCIYFCGVKIFSYKRKRSAKQCINTVEQSEYFDKEWYLAQYPEVKASGFDPAQHYFVKGWKEGNNPSKEFDGNAYLEMNLDVKAMNINPLYHYEQSGKSEKRIWTTPPEPHFPDGAKSLAWTSEQFSISNKKRIALFASYSGNGKIADTVIYYLKGLKEVVDDIIFIADNPIFPNELDKIKDLVCYAQFERHKEYDFGSYKRGYIYAKENGILDNVEELIICNDSCYGPIFPFSTMFNTMGDRPCDFWGFSINHDIKKHIQSFFYLFKKQVFSSKAFDNFLLSVKKEIAVSHVIMNYEVPFTGVLHDAGFQYSSFIPENFLNSHHNLTVYPNALIQQCQSPLIKVKYFSETGFVKEETSKNTLFNNIATVNPELATLIAKKYAIKI